MNFSEKLTTAMRDCGVTAKELSKRSGISESRISQYRKGVYEPKYAAMNKLANALSVNPNWFNGTSDEIAIHTEGRKEVGMKSKAEKQQAEYLGIQEIADILGLSYCHIRNNVVPNVAHIKLGKRILVHRESFNQYLKKLERGV